MSRTEADKPLRRPADVCAELDIQPYVLKFWEGEFPQLARRIGPKRTYGPDEIAITREIRRLLEDEGLSLPDARQQLERAFPGEVGASANPAGAIPAALPFETPAPAPVTPGAAAGPAPATPATPATDELLLQLQQSRAELQLVNERLAELDAEAGRVRTLELELGVARERAMELEAELGAARAANPDGPDARTAPDEGRHDAELARARQEQAETLAQLRAEVDEQKTRVRNLQQELHRSWDEAGPLREGVERLTGELEALQARYDEDTARLAGERDAAAAEREALREPAGRAAALAADKAALEQRVAAQAEVLEARDERVAQLAAELEALRGQLALTCDELSHASGLAERVPALERDLSTALARAAAAEAVADSVPGLRATLDAVAAERDRHAARLQDLEAHATRLEQAEAEARRQAEAAAQGVVTAEALLAEAEHERDALRALAATEVEAALRRVRAVAEKAEQLASSLASAGVLPDAGS